MSGPKTDNAPIVHCRIGSLEIDHLVREENIFVHCRIGSLEISMLRSMVRELVHCRIGSLENRCDTETH